MALRHKKITPDAWNKPILISGRETHKFGKRKGTIMFPTTHDITLSNVDQATHALLGMLDAGNRVLIVSKPRIEVIDNLTAACFMHKDRILFRFTIGSTNESVLKFWEPGAPTFAHRMGSLQLAHARGFDTSVSMEPYLDDRPEEVVEAVRPFVTNAIWIGKANFLIERLKMNGEWNDFSANEAANMAQFQSDKNVKALYARYKDDPKVKWKESIKKVVGIEVPTEKGLDV